MQKVIKILDLTAKVKYFLRNFQASMVFWILVWNQFCEIYYQLSYTQDLITANKVTRIFQINQQSYFSSMSMDEIEGYWISNEDKGV